MIAVGDRIEISINGADRRAVVLYRFNTSSIGKGGFVLGLNCRYRSGCFASWSPVKRNRHDLVAICFRFVIDPDQPLCYTWYDGDSSIVLIQKILGADTDTVRRMAVAATVQSSEPLEKPCRNKWCRANNYLDGQSRTCWKCGIDNPV